MSKFYTLDLWCYVYNIGDDVSYWSNGSSKLNDIKQFVENLVVSYPSDCGKMSIQKMVIKKFERYKNDFSQLYGLNTIYSCSLIHDPLHISDFHKNDFFDVNLNLDNLKYSKNKKEEIKNKKLLDESFLKLWKIVDPIIG